MRKFFPFFLICSAGVGLHFFCTHQTQGFRFASLLSDLPNDPRWEVEPLSREAMLEVESRLQQPFTFLGKGGWCTAFLGKDQKTVLKFYKHEHLSLPHVFSHFEVGKLFNQATRIARESPYFQEFNFTSCALLYKELKERTGLIYVHLNKTNGVFPRVVLYDPLGIYHEIDLNTTEFVVQERADLLFDRLQCLHDRGELATAQRALDDLFSCLLSFSQHGIRDLDKKLYENYGFVGERAIALDLSSFVSDPEIQNPAHYKKEITAKTVRLGRWLKKHYPELKGYFDEKVDQINESS